MKIIPVSVIIPAYNEETSIGIVLENLTKSCLWDEIIVVDDGSTDGTGEKARTVQGVKVIQKTKNHGYGAAIKTGVRAAKNEWILTLDADGQHNMESLPAFLEAQNKGNDLIIGKRRKNSHKLLWRQPGKYVLQLIANFLADQHVPDINSGLRLFRKSIFLEFTPIYPNGFSISTTMNLGFLGDGYNVEFVPITTYERVGRKSNVALFGDGFKTILNILRTVSLFNPLKVFIPASFIVGMAGFLYGIYSFILYSTITKFSVLLMSGALSIFFFGLLADQIALLRRQHAIYIKNDSEES